MTNRERLIEEFDVADEAVFFEEPDYDSAIVGYDFNSERVIYDYELMIRHLIENDDMDDEEAVDFLSYNTIRSLSYAGEHSPIIMMSLAQSLQEE